MNTGIAYKSINQPETLSVADRIQIIKNNSDRFHKCWINKNIKTGFFVPIKPDDKNFNPDTKTP